MAAADGGGGEPAGNEAGCAGFVVCATCMLPVPSRVDGRLEG